MNSKVCVCARARARARACVCVWVCACKIGVSDRNHVCDLKVAYVFFVIFPLSAQCSIFLAQMHRPFGYPIYKSYIKQTFWFTVSNQ